MQDVNWVALIIFVLLFGFITWLGFAAARWRKGDLDQLHEWGLGGRRFGTVVTWFLVGGDLYTAYTFIAVPALAFGAGAIGVLRRALHHRDLPVPVPGVPAPLVRVPQARLHHRRRISCAAASATAGWRWPSPITGIVATMPYIALQLVGIQVVIGALGISGTGLRGRPAADHRLRDPGGLHLLQRPARAGLDRHRQGHAHLHHRLRGGHRDPDAARRLRQDLRRDPAGQAAARRRPAPTPPAPTAPMRPWRWARRWRCSCIRTRMTGILSASSGQAIRRNAALLPGYSFMLGLLALIGFFAIAAGVEHDCRSTPAGFKQFGNNFAVPALLLHSFPAWFVGRGLRRHRHRRAGAGGHHVDRRRQPLHAQHPSRVHQQEPDRQAGSADGEVGVADRQARRAGLHPVRADAVRHPAAAAGRHLDHPDAAGGDARRCTRAGSIPGRCCSAGRSAPTPARPWRSRRS